MAGPLPRECKGDKGSQVQRICRGSEDRVHRAVQASSWGARGHTSMQDCGVQTKAKLRGPSGVSKLGGSTCKMEME